MGEIPVIDFAPFDRGGDFGQQRVVAEIDRACRGIGVFYLINHGISSEILGQLLCQSKYFFSLPETVKTQMARSPQTNCGYVGFQIERLNPENFGDLKEALNVGLEMVWLPELEEFRQVACRFYELTTQVIAPQILRAFAIALGLPRNFFDDKHGKNYFLRLLHYPPVTVLPQPGQLRAGEHTDYGSITLLLQDETGGLEVQTRQGEWIGVPYIPDTLVVNVGDALQHWTNDRLRSTRHRVVVPGDDRARLSRYSLALFCDPNPEVELACLENCCSPTYPPRYQPIVMADFLAQKLQATY